MEIRDTLLIVCGRKTYRGILRSYFEGSYNLLEADNQLQAVLMMEHNYACIAAVVVDIDGPDSANFQLLQKMRDHTVLSQLPAIVAVHASAQAAEEKLLGLGAADVVADDCPVGIFRRRVQNIVRLYRSKWQMQELVEEQARLLHNANEKMVEALSSVIEYRSAETGQHIVRIRHFTQVLLKEVAHTYPEYNLTPHKINLIANAAALHDIGKIAIPDSILNKPGRLSETEWQVMETHPVIGCNMIDTLRDSVNTEYLRYAHNICHYHHEQWDGRGYPEGLAGDEIPICAQVVSLADVYDALTSRRSYKEAYDAKRAESIILENQCGKFSPRLLDCFSRVKEEFAQLVVRYGDQQPLNEDSHDLEMQRSVFEPGGEMTERLQMKYQRLLHFINATIIELDLESGGYQMVYSPDPDLAALGAGADFIDGVRKLLMHLVPVDERRSLVKLFSMHIEQLFEKGLNRRSFRFELPSPQNEGTYIYDVTILRENMLERDRRNLIVIWQRVEKSEDEKRETVFFHDQLTGSYCCRNDADLTLISSNHVAEMLGYTDGEFEARLCWSLIEGVVPEEREAVRTQLHAQLEHGSEAVIECRMFHRDGRKISVITKCRMVIHADGMEYLHGLVLDVSRSKQQEDLNYNIDLLHIILNQTDNVIFEWDMISDTVRYSRHSQDLFGYEPMHEQIRARVDESHVHPDDLPIVRERLKRIDQGEDYHEMEVRIARADGRYRWYRFRSTAMADGASQRTRMVGIIINIDKEKRAAQALQEQAERDVLTRLLNKEVGRKRAEACLEQLKSGARYALMIIDLDNFKQVNDRYGHMFGDAVLARTAAVIRSHFAEDEVVARIGGDEFMALIPCDDTGDAVLSRCKTLLADMKEAFSGLVYAECALSCSIGIALAPTHGEQYTELFQRADQALYRVKRAGKDGCYIYNPQDIESLRGRNRVTTVNERIESDEQPGLADDGIVRYALRRLHESGDAQATINELLALVGQQMNVSRVYIFENSPDNRTCSNTFEWCNMGVTPEMDSLQYVNYEEELRGYQHNFDEQGIFYCDDISKLPKPVYEIVHRQGIKSMLQCAIRDKGEFRGYVGFDECASERKWTKEQISVLSFFSQVLSVFLLKVRAQNDNMHRVEDLASVLDSQKNFIYVIDPDTCEMYFANAAAQRNASAVRPGMRCYEALMGRTTRCEDCPAREINTSGGFIRELASQEMREQPRVEASPISWRGKDACLLVCYKK